jgi:DNA helicase-2/ATP-dependent DNA helicase PcrA
MGLWEGLMLSHEDLFHRIASNVCKKVEGLSSEICHTQATSALCKEYETCRIAQKTLQQLYYVEHTITENTFLGACPGSGKTEVVGLKAAHQIKKWPYECQGIAVLTFTNNAADEITDRIKQFAGVDGITHPHYVGTIDSWIHGYVANPFAHLWTGYTGNDGDRSLRVIEAGYHSNWLNAFKAQTQYRSEKGRSTPIYANNYYIDTETDLFHICPLGGSQWVTHTDFYNSPAFTKFRSDKSWLTVKKVFDGLWETKLKFWRAGFCTYQDIECLAYFILYKNEGNVATYLAKRFPFIIVDECQDLSWVQIKILDILIKHGSTVNVVGDLNQSIYSFKKVYPQRVKDFTERKGFTILRLEENFRSAQPIVDLCGKLCKQGEVTGRDFENFIRPVCVLLTYNPNLLHELPKRFSDYLTDNGLDICNSAILARGRSLIERIRAGSVENNIGKSELPTKALFLWSTKDWDLQKISLQHMGKYLGVLYFPEHRQDSKQQYCPDNVSSKIQWRSFLVTVLRACCQDANLVELSQTWSQWSKYFKTSFPYIVYKASKENDIEIETTKFNYKCPSGKASIQLSDYMKEVTQSIKDTVSIRITTIHQVKGENQDATLLVSSPDKRGGKGGHWSEWLDASANDGEHTRFAYVASSRPRFLLAWAISERDAEGIETLRKLGFQLYAE